MTAAFLTRSCSGVTRGAGPLSSDGAAANGSAAAVSAPSAALDTVSPAGGFNWAAAVGANARQRTVSSNAVPSPGLMEQVSVTVHTARVAEPPPGRGRLARMTPMLLPVPAVRNEPVPWAADPRRSVQAGIQPAFGHLRRAQQRLGLALRFLPFRRGLGVGDDAAAGLHVQLAVLDTAVRSAIATSMLP